MLKHLNKKSAMTEKPNELFHSCEDLCKDLGINKKHTSHKHKGREEGKKGNLIQTFQSIIYKACRLLSTLLFNYLTSFH